MTRNKKGKKHQSNTKVSGIKKCISKIEEGINDYNKKALDYVVADKLLHDIFRDGFTLENLPIRLWAVNGLLSANVEKTENQNQLFNIYSHLKNHWLEFQEWLRRIGEESLKTINDEDIKKGLDFILKGNQKPLLYVFATKFLHYCNPDLFPMIDSRSRSAIRALQNKKNCSKEKKLFSYQGYATSKIARAKKDYINLCCFYKTLISSLCPDQRKQLLKKDWGSIAPKCIRSENTILRVLDKYFWIKGKTKKAQA